MFEKVNPCHPDKVADRIAGALVDLAYKMEDNPKVAVEVLIGHGYVYIIAESSVEFNHDDVEPIVARIVGKPMTIRLLSIPQDVHLANNQESEVRCGDNGIFKGCVPTQEQKLLTVIAGKIYDAFPYDGKYLSMPYKSKSFIPSSEELEGLSHEEIIQWGWENALLHKELEKNVRVLTICQSHVSNDEEKAIEDIINELTDDLRLILHINPLGEWTGGPDVDCGVTNRKLGSDMGDGVTGGGLHGKDLSKADVSVNIWCYLEALRTGHDVTAYCSIGDDTVCGIPYAKIVEEARAYIQALGGFEAFACWGLIRP